MLSAKRCAYFLEDHMMQSIEFQFSIVELRGESVSLPAIIAAVESLGGVMGGQWNDFIVAGIDWDTADILARVLFELHPSMILEVREVGNE